MFHPAIVRVNLWEFVLGGGQYGPFGIENYGPGAGSALVDGKDGRLHDVSQLAEYRGILEPSPSAAQAGLVCNGMGLRGQCCYFD